MGDTSNYDHFCRICAKEQTCSVYVFSEAGKQLCLEDKMKKYLHIMWNLQIQADDRLPKTICINCCTRLDNMDKFVKLALEAQQHLTKLLHNEEEKPIDYSKSSDLKIKQELYEIYNQENYIECDNVADLDMKIDPLLFVQCSLGDSINLADAPSPKLNVNPNALLAEHNYYISNAEDRITSPVNIKIENESDTNEDVKLNIASLCCALCSQTFATNADLRNHLWFHISNCKQENLDANVSQSTDNAFAIPSMRKRVQMDSVYIPCPICGKQLSTKGNLKVHLETHSPKGKYGCDICGRVFRSEANLSNHKQCHAVAYKFTCEVCQRVYPTSSTLRAHSITHSNARPHACSLCDKTFKRNQDLKFHLNQHTGARPYQCPYCPKAFASSGNCFSHRKRMHLSELERDRKLAAAIVS